MESENSLKLQRYYETIFPYNELFSLIEISANREISMTCDSKYIRNIVFNDSTELKQILVKKRPEKFDIGAIYTTRLDKNTFNPIPKLKELVFDVDLTDYPRKCCEAKKICELCFLIVKVAVKLLDFGLKEEFGFKNVKFFFSGGRGVHCWVFDEDAMKMNNLTRKSIAQYFQSVMTNKKYPQSYTEIMKMYSDKKEKELYDELYLRLDINVTFDIKHLLKAPYCVHPLTKRICVNLNVENIDKIKLEDIPDLDAALEKPEILNVFLKDL